MLFLCLFALNYDTVFTNSSANKFLFSVSNFGLTTIAFKLLYNGFSEVSHASIYYPLKHDLERLVLTSLKYSIFICKIKA